MIQFLVGKINMSLMGKNGMELKYHHYDVTDIDASNIFYNAKTMSNINYQITKFNIQH